MPYISSTFGNAALSMATFGLFAIPVLVFYLFIAWCLWRLVNAFEEISLSLAKIAVKAKDEGI
jgi:hypothetical protein